MKIGIASSDWSKSIKADSGLPAMGGSGWIRIGQYLPFVDLEIDAIGKLATMTDQKMLVVEDWRDDQIHGPFDLLLIQRYMNAGISEIIKDMKRRHDTVIVQEIDDWYWGLDSSNSAYYKTHPKYNKESNIVEYKKTIQASDYVIASTPYLADRISDWFPADNIRIVENHADLHRFHPREHKEGRPRIGWVGSTAHRSRDLEILRGILSQLEDEFDFVHVGHKPVEVDPEFISFATKVNIDEDKVIKYPFYRPDDLYDHFEFDIGIVPLSKKPFNHAKSWIKGLEYTGARVPFVATPVHEYRRMNEEYGIGRLAKKGDQWLRHIRELADPLVRQVEAERNFFAAQPLDVAAGAAKWEATLRSML